MNLHRPRNKADWQLVNSQRVNRWQRVAIATNGIVTLGNILSVLGLIFVIEGAWELYKGNWPAGLSFIVVGRLGDLADGYMAELTHTKSSLGETIDTACDKLGILAVVVLLTHYIPLTFIVVLAVYSLYAALFAVLWGRRYHLHTNRYGKIAMFVGWMAIMFSIVHTQFSNPLTRTLEIVTIASYSLLAVASIYTYYRDLQRAIAERLRAAQWTYDITDVLYLYNPRSSNYERANKLLWALGRELHQTPTKINITTEEKALHQYLSKCTEKQTILIAVGGGDGTLSSTVNTLIKDMPTKKQPRLYVLPLWGGNANDFSYMLNGLYSLTTPKRLLAQSAVVSIPLIKINMVRSKEQQTIYACCYASFGASAYAARQLDVQRFSANKLMRWFPPLLIVRELLFVARALLLAPLQTLEIDKKETAFYEHTMINGSRIAKVNRVPIELSEPVFFHALVENKDPSVIISLLRIMLNKPGTQYSKKAHLTFTIKSSVDAQVDGEVLRLTAGTKVIASIIESPLRFISTRSSIKSASST